MEAPWVQLREDSHGIPMVIPMGIPTEILWEWEWKFHSHGNPANYPRMDVALLSGVECIHVYPS